MVAYICPHCRNTLSIPEKYVGASGKCNRCGGRITVALYGMGPEGAPPRRFEVDASLALKPRAAPTAAAVDTRIHREYLKKGEQLIEAAEQGAFDTVQKLLDAGADSNARDPYGMTPLHVAARAGHVGIVSLVVQRGADVNTAALDGGTPLHWAAATARTEVVRILLARVLHVDARDKDGQTPLHLAARSLDPKANVLAVVEMLVSAGSNVNARSRDGSTPLRDAVEFGHGEVANFISAHSGVR